MSRYWRRLAWFGRCRTSLRAQARLGELDKAREALKRGREVFSNNYKQQEADKYYAFWNPIICSTLLAEAEGEVQRAGR